MKNKRILLKNIRKKWDSPEKLLQFLDEMDKQQEVDIELAYRRGVKETVKNYSIIFLYTMRKSGFGRKTLPLIAKNINTVSKLLEKKELDLEVMQKTLNDSGINII